eukprot:CAMPEP_0194200396 /NCGR_PEP_ID=MMETSP0156-20130528/1018_1 /TAXON_ID=33649 /ORGANISM="Thalassionema nitzschioides, Strain L26-B" /LENGTH=491 /DNA_ID=CAMNT_0038925383 /DNA_START=49 /DNA_END=1520 /DNA_ORIENTATION=-
MPLDYEQHELAEVDSISRARRRAPLHLSSLIRAPVVIIGVLGLAIVLPSIHALASATSQKVRSTNLETENLIFQRPKINRVSYSWTDEVLGGGEIDEDDMNEFQGLQRSLGSEIVGEALQRQINESRKVPDSFLEKYLEDATQIEKVAMSSVPQQLPKPAVKALSSNHQRKKSDVNFAKSRRVSQEEELELARHVQTGVALHKVKTDFELSHGREIMRGEWTELAGLKSTKELRRKVSQYRQSKQKLVESNMGLVHAVVKHQPKNRDASYDELVQEGSLGLLRAAELFDPSRGLRFSTYATIWIKGTLSNSPIKDGTITLPQREKTKWNKIRQAHKELLEESGGREPTFAQIAEHTNLSAEEIAVVSRRMGQAQKVLSLDYEYNTQSRGGADSSSGFTLQLHESFMSDIDVAERTQIHADVVATLAKNLSPREARLMRLRYGLADGQTRSFQACADAMGLSKTRTQQLAKSCLIKLREASEAESLQEYLLT